MWRILLLFAFLNSVNSCAVRNERYGKICVCNATYCDNPPKVAKLSPGQVQVIYTSKDDPGFNVKGAKFTDSSSASSAVVLEVDSKKTHQKIIGFGGSFTDSTGMNIKSLPEAVQKQLLEAYFGEDGLEYTLCRVPMGGTDFSPRAYTLDDTHGDESLSKFSLQKEDLEYKIPFMQQAQALRKGQVKFFIGAWTAPLWMKHHEVWEGYALLKRQYYQTWANYALKFFDECAKHNITYWGMTTGNEPTLGYGKIPEKPVFGSMGFNPDDQNVWLRDNLAPTIKKSAHKDIKFIVLDDNIDKIPFYVPLMVNDSKTLEYIDGVATHWYNDATFDPEVNYLAKSDKKDLFLIMSEMCFFVTQPHLGSWDRAEVVANSILEHMEFDYNGYTDWNMILNENGGPTLHFPADAAVVANAEKGEFYKQPFFYVYGHFSKYIRPDSVRIHVSFSNTNSHTNITAVAFERPDKINAIVLYNGAETSEQVQIKDNGKLSEVIEIPAKSLQTILYAK